MTPTERVQSIISEFSPVAILSPAATDDDWLLWLDSFEMPPPPRYCPECGKRLRRKRGKYGWFVGCAGWPKCRYTEDV